MSTNIKKKRQRISKDSEHYVNNAQFLQAIKDHKEKSKKFKSQGKPTPKLSDYIGKCLYLKIGRASCRERV